MEQSINTACTVLSTDRDVADVRQLSQNQRMVDNEKFTPYAKRILRIVAECGYEDRAHLARALGLTDAAITNWIARGRAGRESERRLHDVTGVSVDWLNTGHGEPFPSGPKQAISDGSQHDIDAMRASIKTMTLAYGALVKAISEKLSTAGVAGRTRELFDATKDEQGTDPDLRTLLSISLRRLAETEGAAPASIRAVTSHQQDPRKRT